MLLAAAALGAAAVLYVLGSLPPRSINLAADIPKNVVFGGYHVHSSRSDGTGTIDDIAAAASRAGLAFVVVTDHGDATRAPVAPIYRHGVLCIDAVEVNTTSGHLVALGLTTSAPYPLAGEARDVVEDVHRLGGVVVLAHPDSPNANLRWRSNNTAGVDGIEWLNIDSEWRDERPLPLLAASARSVLRSPESIASLFLRPERSLQRLDAALGRGPAFTLAALDAHARISWGEREDLTERTLLARPTYESMFRTLAQAVVLEHPPTGDAREDARAVLYALTHGRSYSLVRAFADPAHLEFTAWQAGQLVPMGEALPDPYAQAAFKARVPEAPGARLALFNNGREVASGRGQLEYSAPPAPGAYRVEVTLPGMTMPWIVSNAIRAGEPQVTRGPLPDSPFGPAAQPGTVVENGVPVSRPLPPGPSWTIEHDVASAGEVTTAGDEIGFAFTMGPGKAAGQFAALVSPGDGGAGFDRVEFAARASRPLRVSVQLRLPGGKEGERWRRSIYLDQEPRSIVVRLQDLTPVDVATTRRPIAAPIQSLLFVMDTLNAFPGSTGTVWIKNVNLVGTTGTTGTVR